MIIHTGLRTDIPAFYSRWLLNRIKEEYVLVRNPYNPKKVIEYSLSPEVVDVICFCSKNPIPLLQSIGKLERYKQYWHITITPYEKDIEPNVPDKQDIIKSFISLSRIIGENSIVWRYDPIFISEKYSIDFHIDCFARMANALKGYTDIAVISFIDLYHKTRRNFPEAREMTEKERLIIGKSFIEIARKNNMILKTCAEGNMLAHLGVDCSGCMTLEAIEKAMGERYSIPTNTYKRNECSCYLSSDIGEYNTCPHICKYCYANEDEILVKANYKRHNPDSPLLIGTLRGDEEIYKARQYYWINKQGYLKL